MKQPDFMRRALLFCAVVVAGLCLPVLARADDAKLQRMRYDVFAGGVNVVHAEMTVDMRRPRWYRMFFSAKTQGFLEMLAPWVGTFEAKGWQFDSGFMRPEIHESIAQWQGEKEVKTYTYTRDGGFVDLVTTYKGKKPRREVPDSKLTEGTTDALTATMLVMEQITDGGKCEGESEVYDGSRRYKLVFNHKRFVNLEASQYNVYSGPAVECTVEVVPVAGRWHKKPRGWLSIQEQGRQLGTMPTVWFAQMKEGAMVIPVRVRVKTEYGTMFMHMTRYESGDTKLKLP